MKNYLDIPHNGLIQIDCYIDTTRGKCYCADMDLILRTRAFEMKKFTEGMDISIINNNYKSNNNIKNPTNHINSNSSNRNINGSTNSNDQSTGNNSTSMLIKHVSDDAPSNSQVDDLLAGENPLNFGNIPLPAYLRDSDEEDVPRELKHDQTNNNSNSASNTSTLSINNNISNNAYLSANTHNNSNNTSNYTNSSYNNNSNSNNYNTNNTNEQNYNYYPFNMNNSGSVGTTNNIQSNGINNRNKNKRKNTNWTLNDLKTIAIGRVKANKANEKNLSQAVVKGYCPSNFNMPSSS